MADVNVVEQAIALGAEIQAARAHLKDLEARMASLMGTATPGRVFAIPLSAMPGTKMAVSGATAPTKASAASIPEMVLAAIKAEPTRTFQSEDFPEITKITTIQNIRSSLIRLCLAGKIEKVSRGVYRLAPRQIGLPIAATGSK